MTILLGFLKNVCKCVNNHYNTKKIVFWWKEATKIINNTVKLTTYGIVLEKPSAEEWHGCYSKITARFSLWEGEFLSFFDVGEQKPLLDSSKDLFTMLQHL